MKKIEDDVLKMAAKGMEEIANDLQKKVLTFDIWRCLSCEGKPEFERPEMMKHLQEIHHIDTKTAKGTRKMLRHLDAQDWYQSDYEWEFNDLKFINSIRNERASDDMFRYF